MRRFDSVMSAISGTSEEWGFFEEEELRLVSELACDRSELEHDDDASMHQSNHSNKSDENEMNTTGLAELNAWLWDSCELGVAAWMRAGRRNNDETIENTKNRRRKRERTYFVTEDKMLNRSSAQQLWCVTPLDDVWSSHWHRVETALTPRLCPRVFSREFLGGIIVGTSLGSIRVVRSAMTGLFWSEFLVMMCIGDSCKRVWRQERDFKRYLRKHWSKLSLDCKAAYALVEGHRRWFYANDDFRYIASRHAALEALLRELLFSADTPSRILDLFDSKSKGSNDLGPPPRLAEVRTRSGAANSSDDSNCSEQESLEHILDDLMDEDYAALFGDSQHSHQMSSESLDHRRDTEVQQAQPLFPQASPSSSLSNNKNHFSLISNPCSSSRRRRKRLITNAVPMYQQRRRNNNNSASSLRQSQIKLLPPSITSCCLMNTRKAQKTTTIRRKPVFRPRNRVSSSVFRRRPSMNGKPIKQRTRRNSRVNAWQQQQQQRRDMDSMSWPSSHDHFSHSDQMIITARPRPARENGCCIFARPNLVSKALPIQVFDRDESISSSMAQSSSLDTSDLMQSQDFAAPLTVALQLWCCQHDDGRIEVIDRRVAVSSNEANQAFPPQRRSSDTIDIHPLFAKVPAMTAQEKTRIHANQPYTVVA